MKAPIKVLLAEDHTIVRNGIVALFGNEPDIKIIGDFNNGKEIVEYLKSGDEPDVILTDINMPDINGIELISLISENYPNIKVLVLTMLDQDKYLMDSFDAGARAYLLKNVNFAEIIFAIKQIVAGYKYISSSIAFSFLSQARIKSLSNDNQIKHDIDISKREIEILTLIAQGYTNHEIAEKLFTSKRTIEGNRQNLLDKTGTRNTAALINFVVRNQIID